MNYCNIFVTHTPTHTLTLNHTNTHTQTEARLKAFTHNSKKYKFEIVHTSRKNILTTISRQTSSGFLSKHLVTSIKYPLGCPYDASASIFVI